MQNDITKSESVNTHHAVLDGSVLRALSDVAIELRGPLSVILGHSENVLQATGDDDVLRSVTAIEKSGKRMDRIASDILTLGALEHDKGIGIPPNDLPHIFAPFYRVQRSGNNVHRGVGLGLYFVQRVTTCFGGTVSVSSIPSVRTTFSIVLNTEN